MKGIFKWPLVIAAVVVVVRVILEQVGAPDWLPNLFSVVVLYLFLAPVYFAVRISKSGVDRPYRALLKAIALYTVLVRVMLVPTYWLAYYFQWTPARFSVGQGGNVGEGVTPLYAYITIPLAAILAWTIGALVIGGVLGSVVMVFRRRAVARDNPTIPVP